MEAKIVKIEKKSFEVKKGNNKGNKFSKIIITCDVKDDRGEIKTLKADLNEEYAKKYFAYCEKTTKDAIGEKVGVTVSKRTYTNDEGEERTIRFIKYLNFLDKDGKAIIMPKENEEDALDF